MGALSVCTLGAQQNKVSNIFILIPLIAHTVKKCHLLGQIFLYTLGKHLKTEGLGQLCVSVGSFI